MFFLNFGSLFSEFPTSHIESINAVMHGPVCHVNKFELLLLSTFNTMIERPQILRYRSPKCETTSFLAIGNAVFLIDKTAPTYPV